MGVGRADLPWVSVVVGVVVGVLVRMSVGMLVGVTWWVILEHLAAGTPWLTAIAIDTPRHASVIRACWEQWKPEGSR
jgi:hypothetical protein